MNKQKNDS